MGTDDAGEGAWWHRSYLVDWGVTVLVVCAVAVPFHMMHPLCAYFDPHDPSLNHPYAVSEAFPSWTLPLIAGLLPYAVGLAVTGCFVCFGQASKRTSRRWHHVHTLALCVAQAVVLAEVVTNPIKNYAGRHRPDFVPRLIKFMNFDPDAYNLRDPASAAKMMDFVCHSSNQKVWDGMKSFPSGHSSFAFAGWTVVALLLMSGLRLREGSNHGFLKLLVTGAAAVVPTVVAVSRTRDNRHNYGDVLAGSVIGVAAGAAVYFQHYSLWTIEPLNRRTGLHAGQADPRSAAAREDEALL
eukprot:TRINITY_DN8317_c0_g2_i1.p1 TRINITY_DN8317_c0_g2~~TRINITY_DN8317_c0_g2_i1.p1  ORF type:complete len:296 (+),score=69.74 TRINITY_DN8317_c0_g2_i1:60-947(+)